MITVTVENIGNSDWQVFGAGQVMVIFEDGTGAEMTSSVGESINKDDTVEVEFTWKVPDEDKDFLTLTFTIEAKNSDQTEMLQCDSCDATVSDGKDNDEYYYIITVEDAPSGFVFPSEGEVCTSEGEKQNAGDGCNQCICNEGEWVCTSVECSGGDTSFLPSISIITSIISIGFLAILRRKI